MALLPSLSLIAAVLFLAVFGAGVFAWALCAAAVALAAAYLVLSWPRRASAHGSEGSSGIRGITVEQICAAILVFLLLTLLSLPLSLTRLTGAGRYRQNVLVAEALQKAGSLGLVKDQPPVFAFSRNRAGTMRIAALAIAMIGAAMIAARLPPSAKTSYLHFLILLGAAIGAAGFVALRYIPQGDTLWWIQPIPHGLPGPVACFINRNHFAGLMAILSPVALALAITGLARRCWFNGVMAALSFAVMSAALIASLSRGAFIAYLAGILATPVFMVPPRRILVGLCLGTLLCGALATTLVLRAPSLRERMKTLQEPASNESLQDRLAAWRGSVRIWRAYPVAGAGANAFRMVYPQFRTDSARGFRTHAENEYVQILAETGVIGVALCLLLGVAYLRSVLGPDYRPPENRILLMSAGGAAVAAAVHATNEFALHAPLYAIVLSSVLGLPIWRKPPISGRVPRLALLSLAAALALCPAGLAMQRMDSASYLWRADIGDLRRALLAAPTSRDAWYYLSRRITQAGGTQAGPFAEKCMSQAAAYDPNNYLLWLDLGNLRLKMNDDAGTRAAFRRVKELRSWAEVPRVPEKAP